MNLIARIVASEPFALTSVTQALYPEASDVQIKLPWAAPSNDGGSAAIDYKVFWDQGTNNFTELALGVTATSFTKTGVSTETIYQLKV